jgi:hypothetical protein
MQSSELTTQLKLKLTAHLPRPIPLLPPALLLLVQQLLVGDGYAYLFLVSYLEAEAATRGVSARLSQFPAKTYHTASTLLANANTAFTMQSSDVSGKFSGLHSIKRNSQDADRKASWADQAPGTGGILSGMWNNFTKGSK